MTVIHWFRRDLRLHDNPALAAALRQSAGQVIPLFILDDSLLRSPASAPARVAFLLDSLHALDQALQRQGSRLLVQRGASIPTLRAVAQATGATAIFWNRDYTPFARARDAQAMHMLQELGIAAFDFPDTMILGPDAVRTKKGQVYTVFTPFRRTWRTLVDADQAALLAEPQIPAFAPTPLPEAIIPEPLPSLEILGLTTSQRIPAGGEQAGQDRLRAFTKPESGTIGAYASGRDLMAEAGTSRLSPYLRLGCVAPQACLRAALAVPPTPGTQAGIETWVGELAWRDFYYQILANFPHVLRGAFKRQYDAIRWENDQQLFAAWCAGQTGYPIVDAAMRQLASEAWMHNRARMVVASFLTKDLLIDWRWGERYFMQMLVDGDPASNNGGWQWAAGTGTDAQPYFRIFNPTSQGQKFDPHGAYVRHYVPELAHVADRYIHAPWTMPAAEQRRVGLTIGKQYPAPIVDHAIQRERALARYRAART